MIRNIDRFFTGLQPIREFPSGTEKTGSVSFMDTLKSVVQDVNNLQLEAKSMEEAFVRGELEDLHQVTIAQEKARIALELMLEIRNKLLEGYQEIMRMPM